MNYTLEIFKPSARLALEYLHKNQWAIISAGNHHIVLTTPSPENGQHTHQIINEATLDCFSALHQLNLVTYSPERQEVRISQQGHDLVLRSNPEVENPEMVTQTKPETRMD